MKRTVAVAALIGVGVVVGLLVGVLVGGGVFWGVTRTEGTSDQWLAAVKAEQAEFAALETGGYQLTLTGLSDEMVGFTDRPAREVSTWVTKDFFDAWITEFDGDPPNAVISDPSSSDGFIGLTLHDPQWVTADSVVLTAKTLPGSESLPRTITRPTVYIDPLEISEIGVRLPPD